MSKRNVLSSPRLWELKKRRQRAFLSKVLVYFFALAALFALSAYLSRMPGINIEKVEAAGNSIVNAEDIKAVAEKEISGKYLWLFPKTNVLFFPKNKIKEILASEYKRLDGIDLSVENNRVLLISVTERAPLYTWCGPTRDALEEKCYFLDKEGYIFDEAPYFSGDVYFRFYGVAGVDALNPAGSYFAREHFQSIILFKESLAAIGLKPVALIYKEDGDVEIILADGRGSAPKILIRVDADMENLAENLDTALNTEPLKTRFKKEYGKLEYLDLRFGNKVYSKFATP